MAENTEIQTTDELTSEMFNLQRMTPAVDVFENDDGYLIRADLPGVHEDAVDIRFDRGELIFEARRPYAMDGSSLGTEFGPVLYRRAFRIPERIETDQIHAKLTHGVLELELPKAAELRPRRIAVKG